MQRGMRIALLNVREDLLELLKPRRVNLPGLPKQFCHACLISLRLCMATDVRQAALACSAEVELEARYCSPTMRPLRKEPSEVISTSYTVT